MSIIPSESRDKPHIEVNAQDCDISSRQAEQMDAALAPLRRVIENFPVADLYITLIHHARSGDYHVKTSLILSGKTLFTGEHAAEMLPAYLRCIRKLIRKAETYKAELENDAEQRKQQKGTLHDVVPERPCDFDEVQRSIAEQDYAAFRGATLVYEESVRKRAGRWIQRFPEAEAHLGDDYQLSDLVEEVFLNAFEGYERMPDGHRFGDWLEDLIDPSLQALLTDTDAELRNVDFVRSLREAEG